MKKVALFFVLGVFSLVSFAQETYVCKEAKFSIVFDGTPSLIHRENDVIDILYEAPKATTTYIVSYKKATTNLSGKEYCNYLKTALKEKEDISLSFAKIIELNGITVLKYEANKETKYNMFTYETIALIHNGYEIELIAMSKEEDLDYKDLDKFVKSFKVIE